MRYKAVIFDLDDTLLKSGVIKFKHHKAVAKKFYGIELTDDVLREHWGKPLETLMGILYQHSDTPENMMAANQSIADEYPKEPLDDSLNIVSRLLKDGIEVGVVTSTLGRFARRDLLKFSFPVDKFFMLQGTEDVPEHKPDPRVFASAQELLAAKGIKPQDVLYVGDSLDDYLASRDAGLGFIGVTTGFASHEQFEAAGAQAAPTLTDAFRKLELE